MVAVSKRPKTADNDHPMRSLRDAAGFESQGAAAVALGMTPASLSQTEARGGRIKINTLLDAAKKLGIRVTIHFHDGDDQ